MIINSTTLMIVDVLLVPVGAVMTYDVSNGACGLMLLKATHVASEHSRGAAKAWHTIDCKYCQAMSGLALLLALQVWSSHCSQVL
jgi:hypothetical protein